MVILEEIKWVESAKNTCGTLDAALFSKTDDVELTEVLDDVELTEVLDDVELNYGLPDDSLSLTNGDTIEDEITQYQNLMGNMYVFN